MSFEEPENTRNEGTNKFIPLTDDADQSKM